MPGHKAGRALNISLDMDLTEIPELDNLHSPEGAIKYTSEKMADLFGADESFLLVNGSSSGVMSAILACTGKEDTIILGRNSHISAYNALSLSKAKAAFVYPEVLEDCGIQGGIKPNNIEQALKKFKAGVVYITSPTYEGLTSDIKKIAEITHNAGALLIVDEAHGSHFNFHNAFPKTALSQGADIVIQSHHKTLNVLGQGACLHIKGNRVDRKRLKKVLSMLQTTSPSYMILGSLDKNRKMLQDDGKKLFETYVENLISFRKGAKALDNMSIVSDDIVGQASIADYDIGKLVFLMKGIQNGTYISKILRTEYNFQLEMATMNHFIAMTSYVDDKLVFEKFLNALSLIDLTIKKGNERKDRLMFRKNGISEKEISLEDFYRKEQMAIPLKDSVGRVAADFITPYPPGIPIIVPGEIIRKHDVEFIWQYIEMDHKILGIDKLGNSINVYS